MPNVLSAGGKEGLIANSSTIAFQENLGQFVDVNGELTPYVFFKAEVPGMNIWITESGLTYQFIKFEEEEKKSSLISKDGEIELKSKEYRWTRVDMVLKGALIKKENIVAIDESNQGVQNYFKAHCQNGIMGVKSYKSLLIKNIYPGIDWRLKVDNRSNKIKQDFIVRAGADPNRIKLVYEGGGEIAIEDNAINFFNELGKVDEGKLYCYQENFENEVESNYLITKNSKRLNIGAGNGSAIKILANEFSYELQIDFPNSYDKKKELIIDPELFWSTYYGGSAHDGPMSTDCDAAGNVFIAGYSASANFPVLNLGGAYNQAVFGGVSDVVVLKFDNNGQRLWSTYYGGTGNDVAMSVAVDNTGNVFLTGSTGSANFPLQNLAGAYNQAMLSGTMDLFIIKFDNNGVRQWATLYGGSGAELGNSICMDQAGNGYITGQTNTNNFPITNLAGAYNQAAIGGSVDAFILKFSNVGVVLWSTYYGGSIDDMGHSVSTDQNGNLLMTGMTFSPNLPVANPGGGAYTQAFGGAMDAFVAKFSNAGVYDWGTYYGGMQGRTVGSSIIADYTGEIYLLGTTSASDLPIQNLAGAYNQAALAGTEDAFLAKFNNNGVRSWASFYGGANDDGGQNSYDNLAIDSCNNVYVTFLTESAGLTTKNYTGCTTTYYDPTYTSTSDCFLLKLKNDASLIWATYYGGDGASYRGALAVDANQNLFYTGEWVYVNTASTYPTVDPGNGAYFSSTYNGDDDGYIAKFIPPTLDTTLAQTNNTSCANCNGTATITLACGSPEYSYVWSNGSQTLNDSSNTNTITGLCAGTYTVTATSNCLQSITATFIITGSGATTTLTQSDSICTGQNYTLPGGNIVSTAGTYVDTLLGSNGCDSIITTNLSIVSAFTTSQNDSICTGSSYTLPGGTVVTTAGVYNDTLTSTGGCDSIITTNLTVTPSDTSSQNPGICTGQSYTLPSGTVVTTAGTYVDTLTNVSGCDSIITTNLTVSNALTGSQSPTLCQGTSFTLPDGTVVSTAGTYTDTVTATGGCDSIITTTLTYNPVSTSSQSPIICANENYTLPGGAVVNSAGIYNDTLVGSNGCDSIITTTLTVNPLPTITLTPATTVTIQPGQNTTLNVTGGGTYLWFPSTSLDQTSGASVIATPNQTTIYCVEVTTASGCKDTSCVTVIVEIPCPSNENLQVPNAFSPNGDNVNDEFCLQGWDACIEDFQILIYNRWGEKVYESKDVNFCWQGINRGVAFDAQVFVYYIKATYINLDQSVIRKGNISLIR